MDELINKLWYMHTVELYSAIKNAALTHIAWVLLRNIIPSERNQTQRSHIVLFYLHEIFRTDKSIEIHSRLVVVRGWEKGMLDNCLMGMRFYFGVRSTFWHQVEVVIAQYYECTKC